MHVITKQRIVDAREKYPESESALDGWLRVMLKNNFANFAELKNAFNSVDVVKVSGRTLYIFDVGGNKIRIIASVHFNTNKIYIRHVLDHKEYDKEKWKN